MADLSGQPQDVAAHRAAEVRQYSRTVRWMKIVLPIAAVVLIGLIFLSGNTREAVIGVENAADAATLGAGLKLENPRFAGTTDNGEPFVITAISALPDGPMPNRVDLDRPSGELKMSDGRTLNVISEAGQFYRTDERLVLDGSVQLVTSDGYRIETDQVDMDLATRTAVAPEPFSAEGPIGTLRADRARMETDEATDDVVLRFDGNVRMTFIPQQGK